MFLPLLSLTRVHRERYARGIEGREEIALDLILMMLDRHGTKFDPDIVLSGDAYAKETLLTNVPVLLTGAHTMLSMIILRVLLDAGRESVTVSVAPILIAGAQQYARIVNPGPSTLLQVRSLLRQGLIVGALVDREDPEERHVVHVDTAGCTLHINVSLLRVAAAVNARVLFLGTRIDEQDRVVIHLEVAKSTTAEGVLEELIEYLQEVQQTRK